MLQQRKKGDVCPSEAEYDSSDVEFDSPQHQFARARRSTIKEIQKHAAEDCVSSKKFVKGLHTQILKHHRGGQRDQTRIGGNSTERQRQN